MFKILTAGLGMITLCISMPAMSSIITLSGDTVDFIYDDDQPGMAAYGTLSVIGDSIFAIPSDFLALSLDNSNDTFTALGTVQVIAKTGYIFDQVQIAQQGDYKINGVGSSVSIASNLTIVNNNVATPNIVTALVSPSDFSINDNVLHNWTSSTITDLNVGVWQGTSSIDLSLESTLTANSVSLGESAFIQNKFVGGGMVSVETMAVPLPAAIWLMISGLALLAGFTRKR